MIGVATLAFLFITLALSPQTTQDCKGDCPEGYRSVCVQRGSNCNCSCVKDVAEGAGALRSLLEAYNVPSARIDEAVRSYRQRAGQAGEFSFTISDEGRTLTIRGQGFPNSTGDRVVTQVKT